MLRIPPNVSGPLVLTLLATTGLLLSVVAYNRVILGNPMKFIRDKEGVFRMLTKEEALLQRAAYHESQATSAHLSPHDKDSSEKVAALWKDLAHAAEAQPGGGQGGSPKRPGGGGGDLTL
jgi:hypothetical protein